MKIHRLFLAIELPPPILKAIEKFQQSNDDAEVHWTHNNKLHITVQFFGTVEDEQIGELVECLEGAIEGIPPFELEVKGLEFGPPKRPPRMVWLAFQKSDSYRTLVESIRAGIRQQLGMRSEAHSPTAHVTVARFNDSAAADEIDLRGYWNTQTLVPVDQLILFESDFRQYTELQKFVLMGDEEVER